jgi:type II secretory pathway component GspD/PulD (secretin)
MRDKIYILESIPRVILCLTLIVLNCVTPSFAQTGESLTDEVAAEEVQAAAPAATETEAEAVDVTEAGVVDETGETPADIDQAGTDQESDTQTANIPEPEEEEGGPKITFKSKDKDAKVSDDEILSQTISLDLRDMDVVDALKFLANRTGINVVTTKTVSGRVSLTVQDVLIKDVFDIMLRSNGLAYIKHGAIYYVMTETEYKAFYGVNFSDMRLVKVFRLKYAIPEQAFTLLDAIKSEIGRVLVDPESGNVLIMDTQTKITQMQKALDEFEKQNLVKVFSLKYAKAKEVEEILKTQIDAKKLGVTKADERNNQVVVQTLPNRMQAIEALVAKLDRQTKEVLIDTRIIKVKLTDQDDKGIEWEGLSNISEKFGLTYLGSYPFSVVQPATAPWQSRLQFYNGNLTGNDIGGYPFSGTTASYSTSVPRAPGEKMHIGVLSGKRDLDFLVNYLKTLGSARMLSNPKIVAINNQEAKIHIGERQAYVTTTTTASGQGPSTVSEEVQFVDVGIKFSVTPNINDDGFITMKIKPEISSVSGTLVTATNNKIPIIDTSTTETTVMVKDGTTLIVGGMRKEEKSSGSEGIPFLSQLPFIGNVFKTATGKTERVELIVLLTPHIISGKRLTVGAGDKRFFDESGKEYTEYEGITRERELYASDVPTQVSPKPYRDYKGLREQAQEKLLIKENIYEAGQAPPK